MKKLALYLSLGGIAAYSAVLLIEYTLAGLPGVL